VFASRVRNFIVRPFNYTGIGQSRSFLIPKIVYHAQQGARQIELGNVNVARDFSDVRFFAESLARLMELDLDGERVNICSGR
ncbi:NAD-dependent epimerase/dehydratase family protein, partial [Escherichia coli]|uniref:NAD-dependent epimerase/dehydratase family protein n=2 Tax=Pseudomonadota TaxID=1224 RepID=UPI003CEF18CE